MNKKIVLALGLSLAVCALWAADLSISLQVNTAAKDNANNFLTYTGKAVSIAKDQFAEAPDGVSGASKLESTATFNVYRFDVFGGKLLPGGLRNFFLYPIGGDATRTGDGLTVAKLASGSILVRFVHRGTAFEFATDLNGALTLPSALVKSRKVGHTDNAISTDFSPSGKVADIDWQKVWDWSIADGKQIGSTTSKTGKIVFDTSNSAVYVWNGALKFTLDGSILKVAGDLMAQTP